MTIRFEGSLLVKKINSRNGSFCIGELVTDIGDFKVKDPLIDQFEEGKYQGSFWISQIYPYSYFAFGKVVIEIRARLADLQINDEDELPSDIGSSQEPDPANEDRADKRQPESRPSVRSPDAPSDNIPKPASANSNPTVIGTNINDDDLELFGDELYEKVRLGHPLKLDSAIDRQLFRQQIHRLGKLGYSFTAMSQTWSKPG